MGRFSITGYEFSLKLSFHVIEVQSDSKSAASNKNFNYLNKREKNIVTELIQYCVVLYMVKLTSVYLENKE